VIVDQPITGLTTTDYWWYDRGCKHIDHVLEVDVYGDAPSVQTPPRPTILIARVETVTKDGDTVKIPCEPFLRRSQNRNTRMALIWREQHEEMIRTIINDAFNNGVSTEDLKKLFPEIIA
jgi:hypothetical protein